MNYTLGLQLGMVVELEVGIPAVGVGKLEVGVGILELLQVEPEAGIPGVGVCRVVSAEEWAWGLVG